MGGPFLPTVGEVPSEVTVTRDGDHVVVCGVRLSEDAAWLVSRLIRAHVEDIGRDREHAAAAKVAP